MIKNWKKEYKNLYLKYKELEQKELHESEKVLTLLDQNRALREETWKIRANVEYYNGISSILEKYHENMMRDINLLLDKDIVENYIKLMKTAKGDK